MARKPAPPSPDAATTPPDSTPPAAPPAPPQTTPRPPPFLHAPRITTDDPWRDLHPARVWPD